MHDLVAAPAPLVIASIGGGPVLLGVGSLVLLLALAVDSISRRGP